MPSYSIKVPATSGNLGSGFDTFGMAHNIYNTLNLNVSTVSSDNPNLTIVFSSDNEQANLNLSSDQDNLVYQIFKQTLNKFNRSLPQDIIMEFENNIPVERGLGSSTSAILMGVFAAQCVVNAPPNPELAIRTVLETEHHLDNGAPALFGGVTMNWVQNDQPFIRLLGVNEHLKTQILIPSFSSNTHESRTVLPQTIPFEDAVHNMQSASLFINLLCSKQFSNNDLMFATKDFLHQKYRKSLMPSSYELLEKLRSNGYPTVISGAGPSLLVLLNDSELEPSVSIKDILEDHPDFEIFNSEIPKAGVMVRKIDD